jgi:uncharacterized OB-fold protein
MTVSTESRLLPEPNEDSQPYWDALKSHRLDLQTCADCGTVRHYPRPVCAACHSMAVTWTTASGHGTVHSWTISHQAFHPAFKDCLPLILVTVELDEGVRMNCRLDGVSPDEIETGLAVEVAFEDVSEDLTLPYCKLRDGGDRT